MKEVLEKVNSNKNVVVTGDMLSGKTTNILFSLFKKIIDNNENIIVYDAKCEYLNEFYNELTNKGYQVKIINLRDTKHSEGWNPLELPYYCYKNDMQDKAIELLENLANTFYPVSEKEDPFWPKAASNYFIGLCLALFENGIDEEINLNNVNTFTTVGEEKADVNSNYVSKFFKTKDKTAPSYIYTSTTLIAPEDTRTSIVSVVKEPLAKLIGNTQVRNLLNKTTFNFRDITNKPTAIFVIGKTESKSINIISNLFFNQIMQYLTDNRPNIRCNIILDNIDNLLNINNYLELNNFSNLRYYIATRSIEELNCKYKTNINKISDVIKITKNSIELESDGIIEKFEKDFKKIAINKADIKYKEIKDNDIKLFNIKKIVDNKETK